MAFQASGRRLTLRQALWAILLPTILLSGGAALGIAAYRYLKTVHRNDPDYRIKALVQRPEGNYTLPTILLIELAGLSSDYPLNLYAFPAAAAENRLKQWGVFDKIVLSKIFPDTLVVEYRLKEPIAYIQNISNSALAMDGTVIPFHPFYTAKKIPSVRLDEEKKWGDSLSQNTLQRVISMLETAGRLQKQSSLLVEYIDLSDRDSLLDEIDIKCKLGQRTRWLRLTGDSCDEQAKAYLKHEHLIEKWERENERNNVVIDLRVPGVAVLHSSPPSR